MVKRIVLFSDGTGNSSASPFKTNVWRVYDALDLSPSAEQITFYDDGVGSSSNSYVAAVTGAVGLGLKDNVLDLYKFLSRQYCDELSDLEKAYPEGVPTEALPKISCFGFSRGAFTIRVLVGLVQSEGLLRETTDAGLDRAAHRAYASFRLKAFHSKNPVVEAARHLSGRARAALDRLRGQGAYDSDDNIPAFGPLSASRPGAKVRFEFIGLWDTVGAYGMPLEEFRVAIDHYIVPLTFADFFICDSVKRLRHALSIDDERDAFTPLAFHDALDRAQERREREKLIAAGVGADDAWAQVPQRCLQLWFAGVHANVGGGYPDDSLAYEPLNWILSEAMRQEAIVCRTRAVEEIARRATAFGKIYDSRAGFSALYRYKPRAIATALRPPDDYCAAHPEIDLAQDALPLVHESVLRRLAAAYDGYAPIALRDKAGVVDAGGRTRHVVHFARHAAECAKMETIVPLDAVVKSLTPPALEQQARIDTAVFWRRFVYQTTIWPLLLLAALPLLDGEVSTPRPPDALVALLPKALAPYVLAAWNGVAQAALEFYSLLAHFLPAWAGVWLDAWKAQPLLAALFIGVFGLSFWWGGKLRTLIGDRSRIAWSPEDAAAPTKKMLERPFDALAAKIMGNRLLCAFWECIVMGVVPTLITVIVIFGAAPTVLDRAAFLVEEAFGGVCAGAAHADAKPLEAPASFTLDTANPCNASGFRLERGRYYTATIVMNGDWFDAQYPADLGGLRWSGLSLEARALYLFAAPAWRRSLRVGWFTPMLRVGAGGFNEFAVEPSRGVSSGVQRRKVTMRFRSRDDGELFAFVNDAYSGLLPIGGLDGWVRHTYSNNRGTATVTVTPSDE
jgi:uncharacterized protein (DUF2235 family)